ncbi:DUF1963 domain-containing protein [Conchiformibius steedae]|uniref:DUF1963 domain-containing protein n=1 Tax=Conchiformibius steedae TaxID=153493 RepID=A0A3P2A2X4_9NEIS|nr:DUF1963 domain-containing protein [Conchiformibius steedae]
MSEVLNHPLLAPHKEIILASAKPTVSIELTRQDKGLTLWQSKVGGDPYLPKGADHPHHPNGHALTLLAQINFAEVPKLPDFPEKGILQFFIDGKDKDGIYGMNWDNLFEQTGFRVVYYADVSENIDDLVTDFAPYAVEIDKYGLPFKGQYAMAFILQEQLMPSEEVGRDKQLEELLYNDEEFYKVYRRHSESIGHRIGGYPAFVQGDPRYVDKTLADYILLFQLDSDYHKDNKEILWGDAGIGNFFIHPDDLKNLDFSKVLYNWAGC